MFETCVLSHDEYKFVFWRLSLSGTSNKKKYEALFLSNQDCLATVHLTELKFAIRLYEYLQIRVLLKLIVS